MMQIGQRGMLSVCNQVVNVTATGTTYAETVDAKSSKICPGLTLLRAWGDAAQPRELACVLGEAPPGLILGRRMAG